jgi:hypothetical protein
MYFFRLDPADLKACALKLFLAALAIKLALFGFLLSRANDRWGSDFDTRRYDDAEYYRAACGLLKHHAFVTSSAEPPQPTVFRTPGYPLILAMCAVVACKNPFVMVLVQAVLLSVVPVVFFLILREMRLPVGWTWLFVLDPLTNILSVSLMTEGWLVLTLLLSLFCWLRADRLGWRFASLFLFSLSLLIKPTAQFFLPVILGLTLIHFSRRGWTIFVGVVSVLPLILWMYRNELVCGRFLLSTQMDAQIMAVKTIEAKLEGVPNDQLMKRIGDDWRREHDGEDIFDRIMDNRIDFAGTMSGYARAHPLIFARYHLEGMVRILFGTARMHVIWTFHNGQPLSPSAARTFDLFMLGWYAILYAAVAWRFRISWLRQPVSQYALLFTLYNLALIGVLAFSTGGGLKRTPFLPLIYLLLALSFTPATSGDKPWFAALLRSREHKG